MKTPKSVENTLIHPQTQQQKTKTKKHAVTCCNYGERGYRALIPNGREKWNRNLGRKKIRVAEHTHTHRVLLFFFLFRAHNPAQEELFFLLPSPGLHHIDRATHYMLHSHLMIIRFIPFLFFFLFSPSYLYLFSFFTTDNVSITSITSSS